MTYLFSQIAISLALAAIVGGAAGWLAHRARAGKQIRQLQSVVSRQQQQVSEAQTEVSILSGDFDDLKSRSEAEINSLKLDNQKIPALNQNLEKSQLLVRQLMQQHKAELTELSDENEKLLFKSKQANEREKELTKLQAELDIERRKNSRTSTDNNTKTEAQTELALDAANESARLDDTAEIDASEQEVRLSASNDVDEKNTASTSGSANHDDAPAINAELKQSNIKPVRLPLSGNLVSTAQDQNDDTLPSAAETEAELKALRDQLAEDAPPAKANGKKLNGNHPHKLAETEVDDAELEQMFDPVDQHDDLKQIFGIGPVTEKTLNKLGITAYSQLAELKQHDIEKIADALQIFPGRIERDNWVGGARAQLEEVLEDL